VAQHLGHAGIFAQGLEAAGTIAAGRWQHDAAFDAGGFVEAALALLDRDLAPHVAGHVEAAQRAHQQRHAVQRGETFLERLLVDLEQKLAFSGAGSFAETHAKTSSNSRTVWVRNRPSRKSTLHPSLCAQQLILHLLTE